MLLQDRDAASTPCTVTSTLVRLGTGESRRLGDVHCPEPVILADNVDEDDYFLNVSVFFPNQQIRMSMQKPVRVE